MCTFSTFWTRRTAAADLRVAVALLAVAIVVAALARRVSLPDSVVLVIAGLWGAILFPEIGLAITPGLVLGVFIPGLVFAAAYSIDWTDLRPVIGPVVALAIPGVLASAVIVAFALHLAMGLPLELAFVVGAITAATDPVAVVATMGRLDVPRGLRTLVEGESLLNDGTGLVLFALAVRAVDAGVGTSEAAVLFVATLAVSGFVGVGGVSSPHDSSARRTSVRSSSARRSSPATGPISLPTSSDSRGSSRR